MKATIIIIEGQTAVSLIPETESDRLALEFMDKYGHYSRDRFSTLNLSDSSFTRQDHRKILTLFGHEPKKEESIPIEDKPQYSINNIHFLLEEFRIAKKKNKKLDVINFFKSKIPGTDSTPVMA